MRGSWEKGGVLNLMYGAIKYALWKGVVKGGRKKKRGCLGGVVLGVVLVGGCVMCKVCGG